MISPYQIFDDSILTESSYGQLDVLNSCYTAMDEGIDDSFIIIRTISTTSQSIGEMLQHIKDTLLALWEKVLIYFNNYILHSANLVDKYRDVILERYDHLDRPLIFKTYTYPKLKGKEFPTIIPTNALEVDIQRLQEDALANDWTPSEMEYSVDRMIVDFAKQTIGTPVNIDQLRTSASQISRDAVQGSPVVRELTKKDLNTFIDEIEASKPFKDELSRTKKGIKSEYEALSRVYTRTMKEKTDEKLNQIKSLRNPAIEMFKAQERARFVDINRQISRLFNGYLVIYNEAFTAKLNVYQEKIDANQAIISELLARTGILAAVNAKTPSQNRKPMVYDPASIKA